jgi:hypothetical protein
MTRHESACHGSRRLQTKFKNWIRENVALLDIVALNIQIHNQLRL